MLFVKPVRVALVASLPELAIATTHDGAATVERSMRYPVITDPPVIVGALQLSASCALPLVTASAVGAAGVVFGVTVMPALAALVPNAFVAVMVTVYSRPLTNSPMVQVSAPVFQVQVRSVNAGVPEATAVAV